MKVFWAYLFDKGAAESEVTANGRIVPHSYYYPKARDRGPSRAPAAQPAPIPIHALCAPGRKRYGSTLCCEA